MTHYTTSIFDFNINHFKKTSPKLKMIKNKGKEGGQSVSPPTISSQTTSAPKFVTDAKSFNQKIIQKPPRRLVKRQFRNNQQRYIDNEGQAVDNESFYQPQNILRSKEVSSPVWKPIYGPSPPQNHEQLFDDQFLQYPSAYQNKLKAKRKQF